MPKRAQSSSPRCKSAGKLRDSRDTEMQLDDAISDALEPVVAIQKVMLSIQQELREQVSQVLKKQEELQTKIQEDKTSLSELIEGSMYNMCTRIEFFARLLIFACGSKSFWDLAPSPAGGMRASESGARPTPRRRRARRARAQPASSLARLWRWPTRGAVADLVCWI